MANETRLHKLLPTFRNGMTKSQIAALVEHAVDDLLEGDAILPAAEFLAVVERFVKGMRQDDRFIDGMRTELAKNSGVVKTSSGASIEACEAGVRYDYSHNPSWNYLNGEIAELVEQRRLLEERLRSIAEAELVVDAETGEVFTGALKASRSTYRITLSK